MVIVYLRLAQRGADPGARRPAERTFHPMERLRFRIRAIGSGANGAHQMTSQGRAGRFDLLQRVADAALHVDAGAFRAAAAGALAAAETQPSRDFIGEELDLAARAFGTSHIGVR